MIKVAFGGEAFAAGCKCHKGKIVVEAYLVHPFHGKVIIGQEFFETMEEAKKNMNSVVSKFSQEALKKLGIEPNTSDRIDVFEGDDATREEEKYIQEERKIINEQNINLH